MEDGNYIIEMNGKTLSSFKVVEGQIVDIQGELALDILQKGPVDSGMNRYRLTHSLNNGYYKVVKVS
jgi:hypothetical protein